MKIGDVDYEGGLLTTRDLVRGRDYQRDLRVRWIRVNKEACQARVLGTRAYEVTLRMGPAPASVKSGRCTCPAFETASGCKHIAAACLDLGPALRKFGFLTSKETSKIRPDAPSARVELPPLVRSDSDDLIESLRSAWRDATTANAPQEPPAGGEEERSSQRSPRTTLGDDVHVFLLPRGPEGGEIQGKLSAPTLAFFERKQASRSVRSPSPTPPLLRQGLFLVPSLRAPVLETFVRWTPVSVALRDAQALVGSAFGALVLELFLTCLRSKAKPSDPWKMVIPRRAHALGFTRGAFEEILPKLLSCGRFLAGDPNVESPLGLFDGPVTASRARLHPRIRFQSDDRRTGAVQATLELVNIETNMTLPWPRHAARSAAEDALLEWGYVRVEDGFAPLPTDARTGRVLDRVSQALSRPLSVPDIMRLKEALAKKDLGLPPSVAIEVDPRLDLPVVQGRPVVRVVVGFARALGATAPSRLFFDYDAFAVRPTDSAPLLHDESRGCFLRRDIAEEARLLEEVREDLGLEEVADLEEDEFDFPLRGIRERLHRLGVKGVVIEVDGRKLAHASRVELHLREVLERRDWFGLEGEVSFAPEAGLANGTDDGEEIAVPLDRVLRSLVEGLQILELADGRVAFIPEDLENALRPLWKRRLRSKSEPAAGGRDGDATILRADEIAFLLPSLEEAVDGLTFEGRAADLRAALRNWGEWTEYGEPHGFLGTLRPYQKEGLAWLDAMGRLGLGACLADDMGLGKTIQILSLLAKRTCERPVRCLLVAPRSLIDNWKREGARFFPGLEIHDLSGPFRDVRSQIDASDPSRSHLFLTTYRLAAADCPELRTRTFDLVVLDEAQAVKNARTERAQAVHSLKARERIVLTGTPIENGLDDLASLFRFLNPGLLELDTPLRDLASGARSPADVRDLESLRRSLKPFLLRRTKAQVLTELPARTETVVSCPMTPAQATFYKRAAEEFKRTLEAASRQRGGIRRIRIEVIHALLRLRQIACHPRLVHPSATGGSGKFGVLLERLETLQEEGRKVLVFSQFTSLLGLFSRELSKRGWAYVQLDGSTRNRQDVIDTFTRSRRENIFLLSLKAGGVGLNLTAADTVFLLDPWWNPAAEAQAIDRAHRMGQTRPVNAYRLVAKGTVEEKILEMQGEKKGLAEAILSGATTTLRSLTADDLAFLLEVDERSVGEGSVSTE